jgi:hypothetical protein
MKSYSFKKTEKIGDNSVQICINYLKSLNKTIEVKDVQNDSFFRDKDIDVVWVYNNNNQSKEIWIEVKGDRLFSTGNYFLETISNKTKQTPGCFLYTESHYFFYYFIDSKELHIMETKPIREWFLNNIDQFPEKETSTPVGNGEYYITVGRLVKRETILNKFPRKTRVVKLREI